MQDNENVRKVIPLEAIKDKLPMYEEKKEEYRLRHYLYYHVIKKKKANQHITIHKKEDDTLKTQ